MTGCLEPGEGAWHRVGPYEFVHPSGWTIANRIIRRKTCVDAAKRLQIGGWIFVAVRCNEATRSVGRRFVPYAKIGNVGTSTRRVAFRGMD